MHTIEPFYNWLEYYRAEDDEKSPFYGLEHENFNNSIYNYLLHPQWDGFGSNTLYCKLLFADYQKGCAIIELMGEWNDCLHNDIMYFIRNLVETLTRAGVYHFILIGENVLNFHASDDCYYEEWNEEITENDGWIVGLNFRQHILEEMHSVGLERFINFWPSMTHGDQLFNWRAFTPLKLCTKIDNVLNRRIGSPNLILNR